MTTERRQYTAEFKQEAVRLSQTTEKSVAQTAQDVGIRPKLLYRWRRESQDAGTGAFPGHGQLAAAEAAVAALQRELAQVRQERDILKKALGIFSRA